MWTLLILFVVPLFMVLIQKTMFKSEYPIGKYSETRFSYHESGISKKPDNYPTSPRIGYTINP